MTVKKAKVSDLKYKGKSHKVKELVKKLNLKSSINVSTGKTWFSDAMDNLDKKEQ